MPRPRGLGRETIALVAGTVFGFVAALGMGVVIVYACLWWAMIVPGITDAAAASGPPDPPWLSDATRRLNAIAPAFWLFWACGFFRALFGIIVFLRMFKFSLRYCIIRVNFETRDRDGPGAWYGLFWITSVFVFLADVLLVAEVEGAIAGGAYAPTEPANLFATQTLANLQVMRVLGWVDGIGIAIALFTAMVASYCWRKLMQARVE